MYQILSIAVRSLAQHRRRALLLGGAIIVVTALLVLMQGLSAGIRETMLRSATTLTTGHVNVGGFFKVSGGLGGPLVTGYQKILDIVRREVPELDYVVARRRGWGKLISDQGSIQAGLAGIDVRNEPGFRNVLHVQSGNLDDLAQPNTVLLFAAQAKKLEVTVNDIITISAQTSRGINNTADVRVVAICQDLGLMSQFSVFIPEETVRILYQLTPDSTGALMLYLKDLSQIPSVMDRLRVALENAGYRLMDHDPRPFWFKFQSITREGWTGQKLDLTTWEDETSFLTRILTALDAITAALIGILLVIIVLGIMNTLWIAIRERTREIGTLRAIGMQRSRVLWMFLSEAFLLGLLGTVAGVGLGVLIAELLNAAQITAPIAVQMILMSDRLSFSIHAAPLLRAATTITLVTTLAALYPSYRATRLQPITAIHHIG
jgi:ABC-type transport system, involved in lipoprotein release, permease component